jgi:hypothetical protein
LQRADPARNFVTQEKRRLRERTVHPKVQAARDALKAIGGLLFAGLGLLSAIGERHKMMNGEIPWTTALYGGLLLAVWNPQAFHGPERHMAETFSFIKTDTWNTLVQNNRSHLTDDFFWQMTDSKVRALSATIAKTDHANTLQYYDQLKGRVDDPSIAFLQKLEKEHPDQWKILLASTARIATQDERGALQHLVQNNALNTEALVLPS